MLESDAKSFQKKQPGLPNSCLYRQGNNWVRGKIYGDGKVEPKIKSQELFNVLTVFVL